ncbi:unnamed protein product [Rotaria magnacalcarata]|uniref:Uncharacterized protein n=1 Tax=Rotaria magnacalcarata TaxID=392030 RepID=A0A816BX05_9BILA|nr:unnamed protein product [Rotaria magnacalcarata]CAF1674186.1 unnamed protein product [Rotaria magnacalcarata]CAF3813579.1 unnamed protein product [Rotaria magnacalcarata]CAF3824112.1 unnamed protein product [Rotaria magnacalcarata]
MRNCNFFIVVTRNYVLIFRNYGSQCDRSYAVTTPQFHRNETYGHYLPLTTFPSGYRLTHCTACWKIGHMRDKSQSPVSCRKCLGPYTNGVNHSCQNDTFICAQCGGNHFSLDSICPVVKKYREELKLAVDKALTSGAIKRPAPGEAPRPFQQQTNNFSFLNQGQVISRPAWTTSDNESLHSNIKQEMSDLVVTIKALSDTMIRTEKSFNDLNNRIEVPHKSTILHCNSICAIIDTVQIMSSWVQGNSNERSKLKKNINKPVKNLQKWKKQLDSNRSNESTASMYSPHHITTNNIIDNKNNGEVEMNDDFSMNSLRQDV